VVLKDAFAEKSFVIVLVIFSLLDGAFVSFASVLSLLFGFYNTDTDIAYSTTAVSIYGGLTAVFGVLASIITASILQRTQKFLLALKVICLMTSVFATVFFYALPRK
jgi:hypothetical protein